MSGSQFTYDSGLTLYAKPLPPDSGSAWDADDISGTEAQFGGSGTGVYEFDLVSRLPHGIYQQAGASPASTDELIGTFPARHDPPPIQWLYFSTGESYTIPVDFGQLGSAVTGTPTAQLYLDEVASGSAINLTQVSGTLYKLSGTFPSAEANVGKAVRFAISATVDGEARTWGVTSRVASTAPVDVRTPPTTLLAAGGTLTDVPVTYDTEQTDPVLRVYRGASLVSSPAATGTGTTFYFDVSIPADAAVGEIIRVLTDEDPASVVMVGQVVSTETEGTVIGQRYNIEFFINVGSTPIPSVLVTITKLSASGSPVYDSGYTNSDGLVEFKLPQGTYFLWRNRSNYSFNDPVEFTVDSNGDVTYA